MVVVGAPTRHASYLLQKGPQLAVGRWEAAHVPVRTIQHWRCHKSLETTTRYWE
jgi:hypothetical protein